MSNFVVAVPYECHFEEDHRSSSVNALWLHLGTPAIVLVALLLVLLFIRLGIELRRTWLEESVRPDAAARKRFFTYVIIICIVALYFSYIDLAREFLRAINCVEIQASYADLSPDHPYLRYATETVDQHVWAEDTNLVCFEGRHLAIGIAGIVGLFFLLCVIVWIAVWLPLNRRNRRKTEFVARYWFLYQAYRKKWYTNGWESIILARKTLIATVIVFAVQLEPTLQAAMCVGILVVCQTLHTLILPFKVPKEHQNTPEYAGSVFRMIRLPRWGTTWVKLSNSINLNILESISLFASITMFFAAIVLHDTSATSPGRACMIIFTFAVNIGFLLYGLYRLYCGLLIVIDLKLELHNIEIAPRRKRRMDVISLSRKALVLVALYSRACVEGDASENSAVSADQSSEHSLPA